MTQPDSPIRRLRALVDGYRISDAIYAAVELNIADLLAGGARDVDDLAAAAKAQPDELYRLLRALASVGVFHEGEGRRFSLTEMGQYLRTDEPASVSGWAALVGREYSREAWGRLGHSVRTGENAFASLHGGEDVWAWRAQRPEENAAFERAMKSNARRGAASFFEAYDFGRFGRIADIGGNNGTFLSDLLRHYPATRGVLFDQPHVVAGAQAVLDDAGVGDRCEVVGGNFFESVPAGADAYVIQRVLHDWSDDDCVRILQTIRAACGKALLLILEAIVGPPNTDPETKFLDLQMLVLPGGRERSADEWEELLRRSGFHLTQIVATASGQSVIEATAG